MNIAVAISHFLIVFHSSTNFIIYCSKDTKFRRIIAKFLKCKKVTSSNRFELSGKMVKLSADSAELTLGKGVNKILGEYGDHDRT